MQFVAVLRRRTESFSDADFAPLLESEAERVRELYTDGTIRAAHGRADAPGAVLIVEAADESAARAALATLPLYTKNMLELQIFTPLLPYRGFAPRNRAN